MSNEWPSGYRHAMSQTEHEKWNATHHPGTRQECDLCNEYTGRCEEDSLTTDDGLDLCEECWAKPPTTNNHEEG
jgi:hypothetical protein